MGFNIRSTGACKQLVVAFDDRSALEAVYCVRRICECILYSRLLSTFQLFELLISIEKCRKLCLLQLLVEKVGKKVVLYQNFKEAFFFFRFK